MDSRHPYAPPVMRPRIQRRPRPWAGRSPQRYLYEVLRPPREGVPFLVDGLSWVLGAMVLRWVTTLVLLHAPVAWLPVVLVLLLPAGLAVGLSVWAASLSGVLGYRLMLIATGLVLGGRL